MRGLLDDARYGGAAASLGRSLRIHAFLQTDLLDWLRRPYESERAWHIEDATFGKVCGTSSLHTPNTLAQQEQIDIELVCFLKGFTGGNEVVGNTATKRGCQRGIETYQGVDGLLHFELQPNFNGSSMPLWSNLYAYRRSSRSRIGKERSTTPEPCQSDKPLGVENWRVKSRCGKTAVLDSHAFGVEVNLFNQ